MTSGPKVRLGTNWPSITSHWMRSTPASSSAATSSPRRAKSAGRTDGRSPPFCSSWRDPIRCRWHRTACDGRGEFTGRDRHGSARSSSAAHASSASSHVSLRASTVRRQSSAASFDGYGPSTWSPGPRPHTGAARPRPDPVPLGRCCVVHVASIAPAAVQASAKRSPAVAPPGSKVVISASCWRCAQAVCSS